MAKAGLIHDYDLMANREESSRGVTCAVCDTPETTFQWSDYSGEGMCTVCGCTYQLKWGTEKEREEAKYPYMTMRADFVPIARQFWNETNKWVHYGSSFSCNTGHPELSAWMKIHHPNFGKEAESEAADAMLAEREKP